MTTSQSKAVFSSWLILSLVIVVAQLFNEVYEYAATSLLLGFFILELQFLTKGIIIEKNGYTVTFTAWGYIWRTLITLFASTVLIVTLAMIFHPNQFIHHRLLTIITILINNVLLLWLLYRKK